MADTATIIKDDTQAAQGEDQAQELIVPPEVTEKFAELLELIKGSESMDQDERQYWIDVLPIMTEDQILNLRGILDNEKEQLAEAEETYGSGVEEATQKATQSFDEASYLEKKRIRKEAEQKHEEEEFGSEESILAELDDL